MTKLSCLIKASLLTCGVIAGQSYAFNHNGNSTAWRNDNIGWALGDTADWMKGKEHIILLSVINDTDFELREPFAWFDSGGLADDWEWPQSIPAEGGLLLVAAYEKDNSVMTGCSGYVNYTLNGKTITFAFSNPFFGTNKVGAGIGGKSVWDNMGDHDYNSFREEFTVDGIRYAAVFKSTGGFINLAEIRLVLNNDKLE